jgi:hypothetical protein
VQKRIQATKAGKAVLFTKKPPKSNVGIKKSGAEFVAAWTDLNVAEMK